MHPKIPESDETLWDCFFLRDKLKPVHFWIKCPEFYLVKAFLFGFLPTQIQTSAPTIKIIAAINGR